MEVCLACGEGGIEGGEEEEETKKEEEEEKTHPGGGGGVGKHEKESVLR